MLSSILENFLRLLFETEVGTFIPPAESTDAFRAEAWPSACEAMEPIGYGICFGCMLGGSRYLLISGFIVSKHSLYVYRLIKLSPDLPPDLEPRLSS